MVTAWPLTVEAVGFSPGFAYLAGLPEGSWAAVPRRASPRPVVPSGSVARGRWLRRGVPGPVPWWLAAAWAARRRPCSHHWTLPYARLAPGDRVQFTVSRSEIFGTWRRPGGHLRWASGASPRTAQSRFRGRGGRGCARCSRTRAARGWLRSGFRRRPGGSLTAFDVANRLVGNAMPRRRVGDHRPWADPALPPLDVRRRRRLRRPICGWIANRSPGQVVPVRCGQRVVGRGGTGWTSVRISPWPGDSWPANVG